MPVTFLRGPSGCGKTTVAKDLADKTGAKIVSADLFFTTYSGEYCFDPEKIGAAHLWAQEQLVKLLKDKVPFILVDNTNMSLWSMKEYVVKCCTHNAQTHFKEINRELWEDCSLETCKFLADRSQHKVPIPAIVKMIQEFVPLRGAGDVRAILESCPPHEWYPTHFFADETSETNAFLLILRQFGVIEPDAILSANNTISVVRPLLEKEKAKLLDVVSVRNCYVRILDKEIHFTMVTTHPK